MTTATQLRTGRRTRVFTAILLCCGSACTSPDGGTGSTSPDPGNLQVAMTTVPEDAGIVLVELSGGPIPAILPAAAYQSTVTQVDSSHATILVRGALQPGLVATITVPDRHVTYQVTVIDAAAGRSGGYARQRPDQLAFTVTP